MLIVTMVRPIAISGETSAMVLDRSARFSSTNCMRRFLLLQTASAHQQAELLAVGVRGRQRRREMAMEHHRDPVGDFGEFVEILAGHEYGGAAGSKIEQGLPNDGGRARIDAPSRLADHQHRGLAQYFAADDEFLQVAARQARRFGIALGLAYIERLGGAVDRRQGGGGVDETMLDHSAGGVSGQ